MEEQQQAIERLEERVALKTMEEQQRISPDSVENQSQNDEASRSDYGQHVEKINGRLSLSGQKHFYATLVPAENSLDMFGMAEEDAGLRDDQGGFKQQKHHRMHQKVKPPVPKQKVLRKVDLQLLRQKDRFLTKNGLKDFKAVIRSSTKGIKTLSSQMVTQHHSSEDNRSESRSVSHSRYNQNVQSCDQKSGRVTQQPSVSQSRAFIQLSQIDTDLAQVNQQSTFNQPQIQTDRQGGVLYASSSSYKPSFPLNLAAATISTAYQTP